MTTTNNTNLEFAVFEDTGGGLHLAVYGANNNIIYYHSGYEYTLGHLSNDIQALLAGDDTGQWDGNELSEDSDAYQYHLSENAGDADAAREAHMDAITRHMDGQDMPRIADNNGVYLNRLGSNGAQNLLGDRGQNDEIREEYEAHGHDYQMPWTELFALRS